MLLVKFVVILLLCFVIISLFSGLYFLVKDKGQSSRTVNALTLRIGLSVIAIIIVLIAGATGILEMNPDPMSGQSPSVSRDETLDPPDTTATPETSIFGSGGRRRVEEGS
ncbi:twin transmembrane helix small protein [Granulosicoccus sp. 3-233]|uniref:twin transmembrane helix small protein n=1 Tax=Granulosicoccus sp. 3-233 TaxID=3417969 RepID=UPI003D324B54